jgi:hypothetical protein
MGKNESTSVSHTSSFKRYVPCRSTLGGGGGREKGGEGGEGGGGRRGGLPPQDVGLATLSHYVSVHFSLRVRSAFSIIISLFIVPVPPFPCPYPGG